MPQYRPIRQGETGINDIRAESLTIDHGAGAIALRTKVTVYSTLAHFRQIVRLAAN